MSSLPQNQVIHTSISHFFEEINLPKLISTPLTVVLHFLLSSIFANRSVYQLLNEVQDKPFSQKTYHNRLANGKINWQQLLFSVSKNLIAKLRPLTTSDRRTVFIVDDSIYPRARSQKVQLLIKQYDHAKKVYVNGFRFLNLGWSDGNTFFQSLLPCLVEKEARPYPLISAVYQVNGKWML